MAQKVSPEQAKSQANRTASTDAYAQPTQPIKKSGKRSKIKTKRIFASHARDDVAANVQLEKSICKGAPFYVLGPVVTEIAPGYDHIVGAIGGALAGLAGADFLCYLTPAEHLGLPSLEDVKEGVIATKIAAHAADIAKLGAKAAARDLAVAKARASLDWKEQFENVIDPEKARKVHGRVKLKSPEACSMCSEYCAIKILREALKAEGHCL